MTTEPCPGCGEVHGPQLHINRPRFKKYVARVRRYGERRYTIKYIGRSRRVAYRTLADEMMTRKWKRGDVLGDEGPESYYEPMRLVETVL